MEYIALVVAFFLILQGAAFMLLSKRNVQTWIRRELLGKTEPPTDWSSRMMGWKFVALGVFNIVIGLYIVGAVLIPGLTGAFSVSLLLVPMAAYVLLIMVSLVLSIRRKTHP